MGTLQADTSAEALRNQGTTYQIIFGYNPLILLEGFYIKIDIQSNVVVGFRILRVNKH